LIKYIFQINTSLKKLILKITKTIITLNQLFQHISLINQIKAFYLLFHTISLQNICIKNDQQSNRHVSTLFIK